MQVLKCINNLALCCTIHLLSHNYEIIFTARIILDWSQVKFYTLIQMGKSYSSDISYYFALHFVFFWIHNCCDLLCVCMPELSGGLQYWIDMRSKNFSSFGLDLWPPICVTNKVHHQETIPYLLSRHITAFSIWSSEFNLKILKLPFILLMQQIYCDEFVSVPPSLSVHSYLLCLRLSTLHSSQ